MQTRPEEIFATFCNALDGMEWTYHRSEEDLLVTFSPPEAKHGNIYVLAVTPGHSSTMLLSEMVFTIPEEKRSEMALAVHLANSMVYFGSFEYVVPTGRLYFQSINGFNGCKPGSLMFEQMIRFSVWTAENYCDIFQKLVHDKITLEEFMDSLPDPVGDIPEEGKNMEKARELFDFLCETLDEEKIKHQNEEDFFATFFSLDDGEQVVDILMQVDPHRELLILCAQLPFEVKNVRRLDMAVAICAASAMLKFGTFYYDVKEGNVQFVNAEHYRNNQITDKLFTSWIRKAVETIKKHGKDLQAVNEGTMTLQEFLSKE